ncbi:unnamed protein product, partial [Rotaria socialis]
MSTSNGMTPEKKTFKNNATVQIRIPAFQSSPSRRLRSEINIEKDSAQSIISTTIHREPKDIKSQHQSRLKKKRECARSSRMNETDEQRQIRLEQQRERSEAIRAKKKLENHASNSNTVHQRNIDIQMNETEEQASCEGDSMGDLTQNGNATKKKKCFISPPWPEAISRGLKETCLRQFLQQMSMSALTETTCSVCNVLSDELKDLTISTQSSTAQNSSGINIQTAEHDQSSSTLNSPYFYCKNNIILYVNGLSQQNRVSMCTVCQKCYDDLSKKQIPKFSPANNMWLGDVPTELQGLTIPEKKLISVYRHNRCVIKLHSPFHSTTTAQSAIKGNCITFLQNIPNIVNSLPLRLDDLCETLKVIFVGARPPERIQLKNVLTVRKKKIIQALYWLKKHNLLYQNVDINLENIAQL